MDDIQIKSLVAQLDTKDRGLQDAIWDQLRPLGASLLPHFAAFLPHAKKMECRRRIVFQTIKYARTSDAAFQIGMAALHDKSSIVRYRACSVLAYSLRRDALPQLQTLLLHKDQKTALDARAAIDAIENQNHHYFCDRNHTGSIFWEVNKGDIAGSKT